MEPTNPNPVFNPGTNKKNIRLWFLVVFAALSVIFISGYYLKKNFDLKKAEKQEAIQQEELVLPKQECNFQDDEAAFDAAVEETDIFFCDCVKNEERKAVCKKVTMETKSFNQALAQYDTELCWQILDEERQKACLNIVQSGIDYIQAKDPQYLAQIYSQNNNYDKSIELFENLVVQEPNNTAYLLSLALSYAEKGMMEHNESQYVDKALSLVEKAKTIKSNDPEIYRTEGYIYETKPDYEKALASYNKSLELDKNYILSYLGRGHTYRLMGALNEALEDFRQAAKLDSKKEYPDIYANLCVLASTRSDLEKEALQNCQIVVNSKTAASAAKVNARQVMANLYINQKRLAEAESSLLSAKTYAPKDPNIFVSFAQLYLYKKDYALAEQNAQEALKIDPLKTTAYDALSYALYQQGQTQEAIAAAQKGLEVIGQDVSLLFSQKAGVKKRLYYNLANIYSYLKDKDNEMRYKKLGDEAEKEFIDNK